MRTRRTEVSNRRFLVIAAALLIVMISGSWFIGHAHAQGIVQTIDVGEPFDAQAHKTPLNANQRVWINGTYSASKIDNATVEFILEPGTSNLYVKSILTITPSGGPALTWGGYTTSENKINYSYGPHFIEYQAWDTIFKEWLILTEKPKTVEWQMTFDSRASVEQDANNYYVKFTDKDITPFFITIPKPYVIDKNGINRQLSYSYNPGKNILTLNLDDTGLTYPIGVDPVYTIASSGATGYWPQMLINASGIPMIIYGDYSTNTMKLAQNVSGTWGTSTIGGHAMGNILPYGADIDPATDLPVVSSPGASTLERNVTWWASGKWRMATVDNWPASSQQYGKDPIQVSSSGRVLSVIFNGSYGDLNISRIEDISGTSIIPYNNTAINAFGTGPIEISGEGNTSNVLNFVWMSHSYTTSLNITTVTDSATPSIYTMLVPGASVNITSSTNKIGLGINPVTDLPGIAYVPYKASGTDPDRYGRQLNYTYTNNGKWYFEIAATNTTSMSSFHEPTIAFNSSGTPYIVWMESTAGDMTNTPTKILNVIYRISPGVWSSPVTIDDHVRTRGFPSSIAFDSADNLHVAYYEYDQSDLMYYFEPLPSAGAGTAPVASFQQDKLAIIRNTSISLTDGSSNTPTSWDWYSPSAASCFSAANITNQNPFIFPKTSCKICLIATNAFGTDTSCEGSVWVARPWVVF